MVLSADGVIDFFAQIRRTRDAVDHRDAIRLTTDKANHAASEWEERARRAAIAVDGETGNPAMSHDAWLDVVRDLDRKCGQDAEARRHASALDGDIEQANSKDTESQQRLDAALQSLTTLLAEAEASDVEDFRRLLEIFLKRKDLQQTIRDLEGRIEASLGLGTDAVDIRAQLATGRTGEWQSALESATRGLEGAQASHEAAIRDHQDLSNQRRQLEEASQIASLELDYQGIIDELNGGVERWRVLRLARALVDETLRDFERTRQPEVLSTASEIFGRVTAGRYPRIVQDQDSENVALITKLGARRHVDQLSRGTQEQLYLSIRLGLARQFGRRASVLPLVMDDVLVNFDEARAREMAVELLHFSRENQILLFTCHTPTRDLFTELQPQTQVITLTPQESSLSSDLNPDDDFALEDEPNHVQPALFVPEELEVAIIATLGDGPLGISELASRVGCGIESIRGPLNSLRQSGRIELRGQKRGARWCLPGVVT